MDKFTNQNIIKERKRVNKNIIIWMVVLAIGIAFGVWAYFVGEEAYKNIRELNEIIIDDSQDKENKLATVEVSYIPYQFAVQEGNDNSYYIVMDETYMYIAYMSPDTFELFNREDINEYPATLQGTTSLTSREIKQLAIQAYNESVEEEYQITMADFENYFGDVYLNTVLGDKDDVATIQWAMCVIFCIVGLIGLIISIVRKISFSNSFKKMDEQLIEKLDREMNEESAFYYNKMHLYLTNNYIINFKSGFKAIEYRDIIWMYAMEFRTNGVKTSQAIKVMTKDGKTYQIATIDIISKTQKEIYDEIWNTISSKNPDMLLGYTKENIQDSKTMIEK